LQKLLSRQKTSIKYYFLVKMLKIRKNFISKFAKIKYQIAFLLTTKSKKTNNTFLQIKNPGTINKYN
jgi:hypothetical protein